MLVKSAEVLPLPSMGGSSAPSLVPTASSTPVTPSPGVDATPHLERVAFKFLTEDRRKQRLKFSEHE